VAQAQDTATVPATVNHQVAVPAFLAAPEVKPEILHLPITVLHLGQVPPVAEQMMADLVLVGVAAPAWYMHIHKDIKWQ